MIRAGRPIALTVAVAIVAAGCGGRAHRATPPQPKLPLALAQQLAARSDEIAAKLDARDDCGALTAAQHLREETIAAINARRVPSALQEPLSAAANDLAARIQCTTPAPSDEKHSGKGKGKGHGKHHGEGD
jgi:hypothetical protein